MTDINDTTGKFGNYRNNEIYKENKINKIKETNKFNNSESLEGTKPQNKIQDTGVLGRSQVHSGKGADISKSVNEAVILAQHNPEVLRGCQKIFEMLLEQYQREGLSEEEAYEKALLGEEEFIQIAAAKSH